MSNMRDSVSERSVDVSRPSTSQAPAALPFRSKSSLSNQLTKEKDHNVTSPSKKAARQSPVPRQKQQEEAKVSSQTFSNSTVNNLPSQVQNLSINTESNNVNQGDTPGAAKKKNARKKERLRLHMPPNAPHQPQPSPQEQAVYLVGSPINRASVQDFFMNQIGPLYANNGRSRYFENLTHHPLQYLQNVQNFMPRQQMGASNSRYYPHSANVLQQRPNSANIPHSPHLLHSEPNTPRYMQNAMQHPLLSKSFSTENHLTYQQNMAHMRNEVTVPENQPKSPKKSPKRKKRTKNNEQNEDKKFETYISAKEVEEGLKNNVLLEGVLRINPKQFQHSYVSSTDRSEQDVLIDGLRNRNRALEGDFIVVQLLESDPEETTEDNSPPQDNSQPQKKGKVVYIKEKVHTRTCIGSLKLMPDKNRQKALFVPRDHRVPRLNIPFTCWPDNFYNNSKSYENTLFVAKIIDWSDTRFAHGKIVGTLGQAGDMVTETQAILAQTDLDVTPYGPEFRDLFPRLDYVIPEEEIKLREDCRKLCLFSIDPSNCRDIDDAVSCKELSNGNFEIGVHISDVSHFLTEDTPLDERVAEKATTIYMVERAYHMLPDELCMLCSLFPGVDKLAFSVFWEITPDAKVLSQRFAKTVIHSCSQLSYDHAQSVLDGKDDAEAGFPETYNGYGFKEIAKSIKTLGQISAILRKRRFDGGALRIDQPKVAFHLQPSSGLPESFWIYESKESHQLIEEFMLLANMTVAERINEDHPRLAFLRCHPPPSGYMLKQLAKSLKPMGINLEISSAGDLHRSLLPYVSEGCDEGRAMVLNMLCAKPMTRARYFCAGSTDDEDFQHYALNVPLYTHFTSPIRRYADIMVHRLLSASLKYREKPKWKIDKVRLVAAQCNKQKYNAKKAGELSTELYTLKYIELHSPLELNAVVVEVKEKYIDVIIVAMGLNRRIFFNNDFPGTYECIKNEAGTKLSKMEVIWKATSTLPEVKQVIEVFSILKVNMHKGDDMVKVETNLVRPV